jgi:hypothetical protein
MVVGKKGTGELPMDANRSREQEGEAAGAIVVDGIDEGGKGGSSPMDGTRDPDGSLTEEDH